MSIPKVNSLGMPFVRMSTAPPPNVAGMSDEYAFWTASESTMVVGNRSRGMTLLVRSGEGITLPFKRVEEYLSPKPLT